MSMPWSGEPCGPACDLAFDHLLRRLRARLMRDERIHAETLLAASGAIAGFAAQRSLMAGLAEKPDLEILGALQIVTTWRGEKFLSGHPLDDALVAGMEAEAGRKLFSLAAGGAVQAGLPRDRVPAPGPFFARVARGLGGEGEGWPSVDARHRPAMKVKPLLDLVWPLASSIFDGRPPGQAPAFGAAPQRWRPAIAATATNVHIRDVAPVLDPSVALTIAVESAIYASKLDAGRVATALP